MQLNGVMIEDTFAEAFPMRATRLLITADEPRWARTAAEAMTGFATSVIACGCEAGIERELAPRRRRTAGPGIAVLLFAMGDKDLAKQLRGARRPVRADLRRHRLLLGPGRRRHGAARHGRCAISATASRAASGWPAGATGACR